jgi:hypothetical protein
MHRQPVYADCEVIGGRSVTTYSSENYAYERVEPY